MLKNIPKILSPELLKVLCEMGHSDRIVIADGNFPAESMGKNAIVIRCDGHGVPELLDAILKVFPLDIYVDKPVNLMEVMPGDTVETPIWDTYKEIVAKHDERGANAIGNIERFAFYEEAKKAYSNAIYLAPDNMDYRYSLCYLYYETTDFDKCKKEVDAILSTAPKHYATRVLKALLLDNKKEFMQAKTILEENIKDGCDDDFTLLSLGKTYGLLDMFEKAEQTVLKVIERNPENLNYITDLADIYIKEKKYDKSLELADKTLKLNPNYVYGYVLGAKTAYLSGDFETCKSYAQEALTLDMNCSEGYYYLALVRFNEEDYEEAVECMKRAITYDVTNPKYYAEMSKIYKAQNNIKTALEYIAEAESIDHSTEYKLMYQELASLNRKKNF